MLNERPDQTLLKTGGDCCRRLLTVRLLESSSLPFAHRYVTTFYNIVVQTVLVDNKRQNNSVFFSVQMSVALSEDRLQDEDKHGTNIGRGVLG